MAKLALNGSFQVKLPSPTDAYCSNWQIGNCNWRARASELLYGFFVQPTVFIHRAILHGTKSNYNQVCALHRGLGSDQYNILEPCRASFR